MSVSSVATSLAPSGTLRAAINMSNFLLVSSTSSSGDPAGVAPSLATLLANRLNIPVQLIPYKNPALITAAADLDEWDVALLGSEPQRAQVIAFTQPYVEIQATYLVAPSSSKHGDIRNVADVDRPGTNVCVSRGSAYGLWLEANLQNATLHQTEAPGLDASLELFKSDPNHDVLAGLRPWLLPISEATPGSVLLPGAFTSVQQSIGVPRSRADGGASMYLENFVGEVLASGHIQQFIDEHGVTGKLSVAA
jgi:polar amino acid transport system substrate-binding protein